MSTDCKALIEGIKNRATKGITEIVDNPREYFRVQQILKDRVDLLVAVESLQAEVARLQKNIDLCAADVVCCWEAERDALRAENAELRNEIDTLRFYGNKDATALADEFLQKEGKK